MSRFVFGRAWRGSYALKAAYSGDSSHVPARRSGRLGARNTRSKAARSTTSGTGGRFDGGGGGCVSSVDGGGGGGGGGPARASCSAIASSLSPSTYNEPRRTPRFVFGLPRR